MPGSDLGLPPLRARRKEMRAALFASEGWRLRNDEIEAAAKAAAKELRATSGLYWGSYLHVEQSLSGMRTGAPPRFARWDGGHLAVQLQGGLTV